MAKFKKKTKTSQEIPTSALPDIIFMLLFFFMVVTVLRETNIMVKNKLPQATQLQKLKRKSLVSYIYIGTPLEKYQSALGKEARIQVNDVIIETSGIKRFVFDEREKLPENDRTQIVMSIKVDEEAKMGVIGDVKEELKKVNALRLNYAVTKKSTF